MLRSLALLLSATTLHAEELRLNQIQVIGTHNSYHIAPPPAVMNIIAATGKSRAESLDYTHRPLAEQFDKLGIRQIELDIYADPKGGLFSKPYGRTMAEKNGKDLGPDPNAGGILDKPGFKVLHVADIAYLSTVPTFTAGLKQVHDWSKAHPRHVPIMVLVELKEDVVPLMPTKIVLFDTALLDAVDAEIRSVFKDDELITPDAVRGDAKSLSEVIQNRGWPKTDAVRGKVMFCLDNSGKLADLYAKDHPALKGRAMFAPLIESDDGAAFFKVNDPIAEFDRIQKLVKTGFVVRTRADEATKNARTNDATRRDKALASGAQFVSTDYPEARKEWSDYQVRLPGNATARPNPVSAPAGFKEVDVEKLSK
ncbi:MAG TPA: phosphatidylinositol-specific phospholipase C1-like protein [Gemmataceae bacterium]|jgi:hypothetical protein|nr:phosphatidylinositol-specific phospholipase C1-like protein [Gemmataceae bacterium]